ncbi:MAG: Ig-like domain-containing protein, partial [Bacteroidota bacterium]|nr:Ig-like domain-containing protein [Bacteroidota bacterium]
MSKALFLSIIVGLISCSKKDSATPPVAPAASFDYVSTTVNGQVYNGSNRIYSSLKAPVKISFSAPVQRASVAANILFNEGSGTSVAYNATYDNHDSVVVLNSAASLKPLSSYSVIVSSGFQSAAAKALGTAVNINFKTGIDSADKFPQISDSALLTLVQQQTFKYFWEFGHPVSGLARERNTSGETVT